MPNITKKFVNHGMGFQTTKEHDEMVKCGALRCKPIKCSEKYPLLKYPNDVDGDGDDAVIADYPKLILLKENGDETIDLGGDLFQVRQEMESQQKKHIKCKIGWFPRAYTDFITRKYAREEILKQEDEAINALE